MAGSRPWRIQFGAENGSENSPILLIASVGGFPYTFLEFSWAKFWRNWYTMYAIHGHRVDMDNNSVGCDKQVMIRAQFGCRGHSVPKSLQWFQLSSRIATQFCQCAQPSRQISFVSMIFVVYGLSRNLSDSGSSNLSSNQVSTFCWRTQQLCLYHIYSVITVISRIFSRHAAAGRNTRRGEFNFVEGFPDTASSPGG